MLNGKRLTSFFQKGTVSIRAYEGIDSCGEFISISLETVSNGRPQNVLSLSLGGIPKAPETYQIEEQVTHCKKTGTINAIGSTILDYDMAGNSYRVLPSPDNYLEVTSYDLATREVKGSFKVTMVIDRKVNSAEIFTFPDTLQYVGTAFHTRY
jgi:hypothetical protein